MSWRTAQLKYVTQFAYGDALPKDSEHTGSIPVYGSNGQYASFVKANTKAPVIVVGRKGSYGKVNWSDQPCFASDTTFFIDRTTTKQDLRWIFYVLQTLNLDKGSNEAAVPGLSREDAYQKVLHVPSISEQKKIADYLDRETQKIDALIAAKKRLLELLGEKRRSSIAHAVTCGLNADAPVKDSGIGLIGKVPQHWQVTYLRRVLSQMDYGISESVGLDGQIAVLRMGDIYNGEISYKNVGFIDKEMVDPTLILSPGDLLFNRTNSLDQVGKVGIFREHQQFPVSFASYLVRMRCKNSILPEFLNYSLNSAPMLKWARSEALPAIGQANLNPNRYSYLPIVIPPLQEQADILEHLRAGTAKLDALTLATQKTIALLQERRISLISAAVTGQLEIPD